MQHSYIASRCCVSLASDRVDITVVSSLVPAEVDLAWAVGSLLDQGLVELSPGAGVNVGPAELAIVLQTGDISAEEGGKLPSAASALTLVTQLIVQDVGLHLHLCTDRLEACVTTCRRQNRV